MSEPFKKESEEIDFSKVVFVDMTDEHGNVKSFKMIPNGQGMRILTEAQADAHEKWLKIQNYRKQAPNKKRYTQLSKLFQDEAVYEIEAKGKELIVKLLPYVQYTSLTTNNEESEKRIIRYDGKNTKEHKKPALVKEFMEIWDLPERSVYRWINIFVEQKILEEVEIENVLYGYKVNPEKIFRGKNKGDYTKKIDTDKLIPFIERVEELTQKEIEINNKRSNRNKEFEGKIYPLALFLGMATHTHYKSFLVLSNHDDPNIIKEGSTIKETLSTAKGYRRFKFIKEIDLWRLYRAPKADRMVTMEKKELNICLKILITANMIQLRQTGNPTTKTAKPKKFYIMNPTLVYSSPNMKCDEEWKEEMKFWFNIGDFEEEETEENTEE